QIERAPFVRQYAEGGVAGTFVALAALAAAVSDGLIPEAAPALVYAWQPEATPGSVQALRAVIAATGRNVELALCQHPGGRPVCWCRPPLPGMLLAFAGRQRIDLRQSTLVGASTTDAAMARALGMSFQKVSA
ncbi:MAG TPA: hypothetical protein VJR89_31965, partial [Polyangiales bacterium]|nr:hypothetical protein [Polyangiales bacterium]